MKCPQCSAENPGAPRFCGECGTPLAGGAGPGPAGAERTATQIIPSVELEPGAVFAGRYLVIEELGAGGMGRVFRVLDRKIGEEIALKIVKYDIACDPRTLERLRDELKAARQVNHRNVARVHDLNEAGGVPYITMQFIRGENLRRLINKVGRLDAGQAIPIAIQVCQGLSEAHRQKIVHRDLKPQNIMIDEQGHALIMDFGLARLVTSVERRPCGAREGTPAYISPEQIEGRPVDTRSDLYSLGAVLYEMLTGHPPFRADARDDMIMKHLKEAPRDPRETNPDIPRGLSEAVLKCLEKDPGKRFQSAEEVTAELGRLKQELTTQTILLPSEWRPQEEEQKEAKRGARRRAAAVLAALALLAAAGVYWYFIADPSPFRPSIAVLLEGRNDESLESRSLELQKNIIGKLAAMPRLRVVPWEVVAGYAHKTQSAKRAGADLEAKYLLLLNLRPVERSYRLTANLVEAARGDIVQPYIRELPEEDYFSLEDGVAREVARALRVHLVEERLRKIKLRETKNLEAYDHYLNGQSALSEDFEEAIRHFSRAVEIDPRYALAYWGLGNAFEGLLETAEGTHREETRGRMFAAYRQAFDLNAVAPETNLGMGWAHFYEADNLEAAGHFRAALKLDAGSVMVNLDAGAFLRSVGLYDRARRYLERAARLNPIDHQAVMQMAQCQTFMGRYESARKLLKEAVPKAPGDRQALNAYAFSLVMTGRHEEAEAAVEGIMKIDPQGRRPLMIEAVLAAAMREKQKALDLLAMQGRSWLTLEETSVFLLLGMKEEALANIEAGIERAFTERRMYLYSYPCLSSNRIFRSLRGETRFEAILKQQKERYRKELKPLEKL